MMYIVLKDGAERTWHIGNPKPQARLSMGINLLGKEEFESQDYDDVVEIQADGHELDHIMRNFTNLPFRLGKCVTKWKGDWAQFIYDNLT